MGRWLGGTKGLYEHRGWYEAPIRYGAESVTVTLNTEKAEASGVEVLESDLLIVLCAARDGRLDAGSLRRVFMAGRPAT